MTFDQIARNIKQTLSKLPKEIGDLAVNHFLDGFQREGLESEPKWTPRKGSFGDRTTRRNLLVKTGKLRRSIRIIRLTPTSVSIGSDMPYAQIQNEGGITHPSITAKSRKYFWAMYKKTGSQFWKNMATTKKTNLTINIPARPFMKFTPALKNIIGRHIAQRIKEMFQG
jgi:phage gpG-like protein